jgi:hypothetical protein
MAQPHKPTEPKGATLLALRKNSRAVAVRYFRLHFYTGVGMTTS